MAKKAKSIEVSKFGGTEKIAETTIGRDPYEFASMEAESDTKLEHDEGHGAAIVIRCFKFRFNPEVLAHHIPTKQELFNSHHKGIELALWKDGLKVWPDVDPRIVIDEHNMTYDIFVGAKPSRGMTLYQEPQTLTQVAHG
jgi:hypothetical protein